MKRPKRRLSSGEKQKAVPTLPPAASQSLIDDLPPWHITSMGCLWASVVLMGLTLVAFPVDVALTAWIRQDRIRGDLERLVMLGEVFGNGLSVLCVIMTAAAIDQRGWRITPRLLLGAFGAGLLADICKTFVARWRPNADFRPVGFRDSFVGWFPWIWQDELPTAWNRGLQSFPSGHSATAVGLALALSIFYPRATWWFIILAILAAFQRIESRAHYLSDTLAGAALACLFTALLLHSRWLERKLRKLETLPVAGRQAAN